MKIVCITFGIFTIAAIIMALPALCACSFLLAWDVLIRLGLSICVFLEYFIMLGMLVSFVDY
jgi:hypothetical protein